MKNKPHTKGDMNETNLLEVYRRNLNKLHWEEDQQNIENIELFYLQNCHSRMKEDDEDLDQDDGSDNVVLEDGTSSE